MPALTRLTRSERPAALFAVGATVLSVVSATLLAFAADSNLALDAHRCDKTVGTSQRQACLREVAEAQRASNRAPTRLAKH